MDLLTAILACNLYAADEPLVRAIAQSNSHSNAFFVVDPTRDFTELDVPPEPKTLEAATARLADIAAQGGRPLLGLMQVPPAWMTFFGREVTEAFDPCTNISVGTAMLSAMDHECAAAPAADATAGDRPRRRRTPGGTGQPPRRACVVRKYGEAIGMPDFELITTLELREQRPLLRGAAPTDAPVLFPAPAGRTWGPDCILVPEQSLEAGPAPEAAATPRAGR